MRSIITLLLSMCACSASQAGADAYFCEIQYRVGFGGDGRPQLTLQEPVTGDPTLNRFSIDRKIGKKVGGPFGTFQDQIGNVLAKGNSQSSFISTWQGPAAGDGVHFDLLRVEEFHVGLKKPFVAIAGGFVYSGVCD